MRRLLLLAAALPLAACDRAVTPPAPTASPAAAATARTAPSADRKPVPASPPVRLLEVVTGERIADAERRRLDALDETERRKNPDAYAANLRQVNLVLRRFEKGDAIADAELRHRLRVELHYNLDKTPDPVVAALLDRYDPVLVEDRPRRELVTRADFRALEASNRYVGDVAGIPVPPVALTAADRAELNTRYAREPALRTALIDAQVRHATMVAAMARLPAARRAEFERAVRKEVRTPEQAADGARELEQGVMAGLQQAQRRRRQARNAAAAADFNSWFRSRWQAQLYMGRQDARMRNEDLAGRALAR